jgi:hypothetical protein
MPNSVTDWGTVTCDHVRVPNHASSSCVAIPANSTLAVENTNTFSGRRATNHRCVLLSTMLSSASWMGSTTTAANDQIPTRSMWRVGFLLRTRSSCRRDSWRWTAEHSASAPARYQSVANGAGAVTVVSTMQVIAATSQTSM